MIRNMPVSLIRNIRWTDNDLSAAGKSATNVCKAVFKADDYYEALAGSTTKHQQQRFPANNSTFFSSAKYNMILKLFLLKWFVFKIYHETNSVGKIQGVRTWTGLFHNSTVAKLYGILTWSGDFYMAKYSPFWYLFSFLSKIFILMSFQRRGQSGGKNE